MSSYCSNRIASQETVNARPAPHGTHSLLGQIAHINIAHGCLRSMLPLWGGLRRVRVKAVPRGPCPFPFPAPLTTGRVASCAHLSTSHHKFVPSAPASPTPSASSLPSASGSPQAACMANPGPWLQRNPRHSYSFSGAGFFSPSFPIQISHINDFVHSEKLKVAPLPSAKSELVLLRCVVMICHQRDRSEQKEQ